MSDSSLVDDNKDIGRHHQNLSWTRKTRLAIAPNHAFTLSSALEHLPCQGAAG